MTLSMMRALLVVTMLLLEEQLLGYQVDTECDRRDAEAGEGALEAVPAREGTGVSPLFTARSLVSPPMAQSE